jgi:hypothetical protein
MAFVSIGTLLLAKMAVEANPASSWSDSNSI